MRSEEVVRQTEEGIDELIRALEQGMSDRLLKFLAFQAQFHEYSFRNCMLIAMQRPDATYVAGYRRWLQLGRHVRKGEKGIMILAPLVRRQKPAQEENEDERSNGTVYGFKVAFVFDISSTEGDDIPDLSRISGDPGEKLQRLIAFVAARGIELEYAANLGGADGISKGGRILLREGMSPAEEFSVLVHEASHEVLHRGKRRQETTREIRELEAEAVAFVVSKAAGLDAVGHSADYIKLYSGDKDMLLASLDHIQRVSAEIIRALAETSAINVPAVA